jgi:hypothetical protein
MGMKITGLNKFTATLRTRTTRILDGGAQVAEDAADYGVSLMREYIATRGTGYVGKGARATPEGRIDTGQMYDAVKAGQVRRNPSGVAVSFGWGIDGSPVPSYFLTQENEPTPGGFPPMHALLDATIHTREYFYAELKKIARRA